MERPKVGNVELVQVGSVSACRELQVGKSCFAYLIRLSAQGDKQFPVDQPIFFDLRRAHQERSHGISWGLEVDVPVVSLVPPSARTQLPSFLVPPQVKGEHSLRFLFSSCRRAADEGDDAVTLATEGLSISLEPPKRSGTPPSQRPHLSLMIGDQVYADDVAPWLAPHVRRLASLLIGREEVVPAFTPTGRGGFAPTSPWSDVADEKREAYFRANGFTSETLKCHCASLGEFVALYCLAFAGLQLDRAVFGLPNPSVGQFGGDVSLASAARELQVWLKDKEAYRRLLSNVATYFILDDHEVTDDWNIDEQWKKSAKRPLRDQYVIPNALLAYFAFQGWGNDPDNEQWIDEKLRTLQKSVRSYFEATNSRPQPNPNFACSDWHWDYSTPTRPAIILLDTRTYRSHVVESTPHLRYLQLPAAPEIAGSPLPAQERFEWVPQTNWSNTVLLGNEGMMRLEAHLNQAHGFPTCFIVSPCIVFGFDWLDSLIDTLGPRNPEASRIRNDRENWSTNPLSYSALCKLLGSSPFKRLVFLSGDVHFGYQMEGTLSFDGHVVRALQVVSSASKNETSSQTKQLLRQVVPSPSDFIAYWFQGLPKEVRSVTSSRLFDLCNLDAKPSLRIEMKMMASGQNSEFLFRNNWGEMIVTTAGVKSRLLTRRVGKEQATFERWDQ